MGSPKSGITAENFLQNLEQQLMKHIFENKTIIYYVRYMDEILLYTMKTISQPK
jgi:hypothetical protein